MTADMKALTRFAAQTALSDDGCIIWTGRPANGYGQFWFEGRFVAAHRWIYEATVEPIPDGLTLDHLCRIRMCVLVDDLEPVTLRENLLRGDTAAARNAAATHCPQGHPYAGSNLTIKASGARACRACARAYAERKARQRGVPERRWGECKRGHDLTDSQHRYIAPDGRVRCRTCRREASRRWRGGQTL